MSAPSSSPQDGAARPAPAPAQPPAPAPAPAPLPGLLLAALAVLALLRIYGGWEGFGLLAGAAFAGFCIAARKRLGLREKYLVGLALLLAAGEAALGDDPWTTLPGALDRAAFLAAFMLLLGLLRDAASTSPSVAAAGRFMTRQPPRRRYAALSWGAHAMTVLLNFGSINLLAPLIEAGVKAERARGAPEAVAALKSRRQHSAVLRGFATAITWAPTTVTQALMVSMFPGVSPLKAIALGLGFSLVAFLAGLAEDMIRHRPGRLPPDLVAGAAGLRAAPAGAEPGPRPGRAFAGLGLACFALIGSALAVRGLTGVTMVPALMLAAPTVTAGWLLIQNAAAGPAGAVRALGVRAKAAAVVGMPASSPEAVTLGTAGFIGLMLADLVPTDIAAGLVSALPDPALLALLPLIVLGMVQLAISPIVTAVFLGSALAATPTGIDPALLALALSGGWALCLTGSPFGAGGLITARATGLPATQVTWGWNLRYTLLAWAVLSLYLGVLSAVL
ncbi:hypothetical protein ACQ5SO_04435 [Rhodovulum sp. DZ06]|uniref:hypothetical protein n=1 Tax=Rhodovulum sp. DZ06 TaxID=3425126 RepID=UPI003D33BB30